MMSSLDGRLCQICSRSIIFRGKALNAREAHCWQSRRTMDLLSMIRRLFEAWHENLERSRFIVENGINPTCEDRWACQTKTDIPSFPSDMKKTNKGGKGDRLTRLW